jgi:hypothetical protein
VNVVYIAGWGRSGSTLIGSILGQIPGYFAAGELRYIWDRGLLENWRCGCGEPFRTCPVWSAIMRQTSGTDVAVGASQMSQWSKRVRTRAIPAMWLGLWDRSTPDWRRKYLGALGSLYRAVQKVTACPVIVDSSKDPAYGYLLGSIPGVHLYVIHLVRDPRPTAHSWWRRPKPHSGVAPSEGDRVRTMRRIGPLKSTIYWNAWNLGAESLFAGRCDGYQRMRFEEFLEAPASVLSRLISALPGGTGASLPSISDRTIELHPTHAFSGNPSRFETGPVQLRSDEAWREGLGRLEKSIVMTLAWPLMRRYGYLRK